MILWFVNIEGARIHANLVDPPLMKYKLTVYFPPHLQLQLLHLLLQLLYLTLLPIIFKVVVERERIEDALPPHVQTLEPSSTLNLQLQPLKDVQP